jgi:hypothetical protein
MDYVPREKRAPTKEEREAKQQKSRQEASKALAERKKDDEAFRANFERLKAERLAREARVRIELVAGADVPPDD